MRAAIIENNTVTNIIEVADIATAFRLRRPVAVVEGEEPSDPPEMEWYVPDGITIPHMIASETARIGDLLLEGVIVPAPPAAPRVPTHLTALQLRKALNAAGNGWRATLETDIDGGLAPVEAADLWNWEVQLPRVSPLSDWMVERLAITEAQLDALFVAGASL